MLLVVFEMLGIYEVYIESRFERISFRVYNVQKFHLDMSLELLDSSQIYQDMKLYFTYHK